MVVATVSCTKRPISPGTVVAVIDNAPRTLDPLIATDAISQNFHNLIYGALIRIDENLKIVPELAEKYFEKNYNEYHFTLKKNLYFQDGTPLTGEDVIRCIHAFQDPKSPHADVFSKISAIKKVSKNEIVFFTDKPRPYFIYELTLLKIFKISKGEIVGSGRYQLESFETGSIRLKRFEPFVDPGISDVKGIELRVVADDITRYQLFKRGDVNVLYNALSLTLSQHILQEASSDLIFKNIPSTTVGYIAFNFKNPFLKVKEVRQAIAMSFDRKYFLENRIKDFGKITNSLLSPLHADFEPSLKDYEYNPQKAERILDAAGFARNPKTGIRFHLEFKTTGDKGVVDFVEIFKKYMAVIGIDVLIRSLEFGTFYSDLRLGNFDMVTSRWVGITNPQIMNRVFHSSQIGKLNRGGYFNQSLDELLDKADQEKNDSTRKEYYSKVQKIVAEDLPYRILWTWTAVLFTHKPVSQIQLFPNGNFLTFAYLNLDGEKKK